MVVLSPHFGRLEASDLGLERDSGALRGPECKESGIHGWIHGWKRIPHILLGLAVDQLEPRVHRHLGWAVLRISSSLSVPGCCAAAAAAALLSCWAIPIASSLYYYCHYCPTKVERVNLLLPLPRLLAANRMHLLFSLISSTRFVVSWSRFKLLLDF